MTAAPGRCAAGGSCDRSWALVRSWGIASPDHGWGVPHACHRALAWRRLCERGRGAGVRAAAWCFRPGCGGPAPTRARASARERQPQPRPLPPAGALSPLHATPCPAFAFVPSGWDFSFFHARALNFSVSTALAGAPPGPAGASAGCHCCLHRSPRPSFVTLCTWTLPAFQARAKRNSVLCLVLPQSCHVARLPPPLSPSPTATNPQQHAPGAIQLSFPHFCHLPHRRVRPCPRPRRRVNASWTDCSLPCLPRWPQFAARRARRHVPVLWRCPNCRDDQAGLLLQPARCCWTVPKQNFLDGAGQNFFTGINPRSRCTSGPCAASGWQTRQWAVSSCLTGLCIGPAPLPHRGRYGISSWTVVWMCMQCQCELPTARVQVPHPRPSCPNCGVPFAWEVDIRRAVERKVCRRCPLAGPAHALALQQPPLFDAAGLLLQVMRAMHGGRTRPLRHGGMELSLPFLHARSC